jgi:hypothetical protein
MIRDEDDVTRAAAEDLVRYVPFGSFHVVGSRLHLRADGTRSASEPPTGASVSARLFGRVDARLDGGDVGAGRGARFAAQAQQLRDPDLRHPRETSGRLPAGLGVPPSKEIELVADGRSARQLSVGPPLAGVQDATVPACTVSGPPEME